MNQLTAMQRGVLNAAGDTVTSKSFEEDFAFDMTGNWLNYKQDANGDGTFEVNQTRTHNTANEIQTISGGNTLVSHDRNGNMTKFPKPLDGITAYTLVYDAWNRLAQVKDDTTVVATYVYDARNHRIKKTVGTVVTLSYFNQNWQEIESIAAGVTKTNVYGLRYIDGIICRTSGNNGETQTLYALQDPNWNVVALANTSSTVAERLTYDSFGKPTFRNASFVAKTTSSYSWTKTFTGQVYDSETGLMLYRNRYYHTGLGRFITRDPIGYRGDSSNMYRYVKNCGVNFRDDLGFRFLGNICSEGNCAQKYQSCAMGITGAFAICMGWEPALDLTITLTCTGVCQMLVAMNLVSATLCYLSCSVYGTVSLLTSAQICSEMSQKMDMECGNKYNQCTYATSCCGNPQVWKRCGRPVECENWRPD